DPRWDSLPSIKRGDLAIKPLGPLTPEGKTLPSTPVRPPSSAEAAPDGKSWGTSTVQMWRTIPRRPNRVSPTLSGGEFTVMAGYANAIKKTSQLIWIFEQYFWSRPLARLLNSHLRETPGLRLIMVLPPHADMDGSHRFGPVEVSPQLDVVAHHARQLALDDLTSGLPDGRIGIYNLWNFKTNLGI